jgi:hypothetical protein
VHTHSSTISSLRATLSAHRAERRRLIQIQRELAQYTSPADRLELDTMIGRASEQGAAELEAIRSHHYAA